MNNSIWGKLYRKSLFKGFNFPDGKLYEDLDIFAKLLLVAKRYVISSRIIYMYRRNMQSILHTFNSSRLCVLGITESIEEYMRKKNDVDLIDAAVDRRFAANYNMFRLMNASPDRKEYVKEIENTYRYIRSKAKKILFHPRSRLKNRIGALAVIILPEKILSRL